MGIGVSDRPGTLHNRLQRRRRSFQTAIIISIESISMRGLYIIVLIVTGAGPCSKGFKVDGESDGVLPLSNCAGPPRSTCRLTPVLLISRTS